MGASQLASLRIKVSKTDIPARKGGFRGAAWDEAILNRKCCRRVYVPNLDVPVRY